MAWSLQLVIRKNRNKLTQKLTSNRGCLATKWTSKHRWNSRENNRLFKNQAKHNESTLFRGNCAQIRPIFLYRTQLEILDRARSFVPEVAKQQVVSMCPEVRHD